MLGYLIECRLSAPYSPFKLNTVTVGHERRNLSQRFPGMTPAIMKFLPELLTHEPATWQGVRQRYTSGGWSMDIYRQHTEVPGSRYA